MGHAGGRPRLTWRNWKQFSWAAKIPARRSAKDRILELRSWGFSTWNSSSTRQGCSCSNRRLEPGDRPSRDARHQGAVRASKRDRPSGNSQTPLSQAVRLSSPTGRSICNNCFKGLITLIQQHLDNRQTTWTGNINGQQARKDVLSC